MSRIGKKPITVPAGVEVKIDGAKVTVKGPKGELVRTFQKAIEIKQAEGQITVTPKNEERETRAFWGLTRTLIENMITGVTTGFKKRMELNGVGYRFMVNGTKSIRLELGYSNPIEYKVPEGIVITQDEKLKNLMTVSGIDKQKVGQVCAEIRAFRPPEPYKGKGIKYEDEHIKRKAGKSAASASA